MKQLLPLLLLFLLPFMAQAQTPGIKVEKTDEQSYRDLLTNYLNKNNRRTDTIDLTSPKALILQNPRPGIHRLPQDNMPCLVPDPLASVSVPNAWKGEIGVPFRSQSPRMPNPAKPILLSRSLPLRIKPETR